MIHTHIYIYIYPELPNPKKMTGSTGNTGFIHYFHPKPRVSIQNPGFPAIRQPGRD